MKNYCRNAFLAALILFVVAAPRLFALDVPPLTSHVNDYAQMLSKQTSSELEQQLTEFEQSDSTQIVILTIPSLQGDSLEDFSIKVAEAWKIGWKGADNGVILLIARDDRKIRIEVGRGLEGKLTDLMSGRIIRNRITPQFRKGDFDGGVRDGVQGIIEVVRGEFTAKDKGLQEGRRSKAPPIFALLLFLFVLLIFVGAISKLLGAAAGMVGLPLAAKLAFPALPLAFLGGLGVAGIIAGIVVSLIFAGGRRGGGRPWGGGGWGGWGGPFIGGGGSSSGGGFDGGFSGGGGDFGGGGASGDW